jgi:hypothetical protein
LERSDDQTDDTYYDGGDQTSQCARAYRRQSPSERIDQNALEAQRQGDKTNESTRVAQRTRRGRHASDGVQEKQHEFYCAAEETVLDTRSHGWGTQEVTIQNVSFLFAGA